MTNDIALVEDQVQRSRSQFWFNVTMGVSLCIGVVTLVRWAADYTILSPASAASGTAHPAGALAFILITVSLWLRHPGYTSRRARRNSLVVARLSAALVALVALVVLGRYVLGLQIGANRLQFLFDLSVGGITPAPYTALEVALLSCAVLGLDVENRSGFRPAKVLVFLAAWFPFLTLTGYLYGLQSISALTSYHPLTLSSAANAIVLGAGILLLAQPGDSVITLVASHSVGGLVVRRILPAVLGITLLLGWLLLKGELAGLYSTEVGVVVFTTSNALMLAAVVSWNAMMLHRLDMLHIRDTEMLKTSTAAAEHAKEVAEQAKLVIEQKAEQLAQASKYKSEFLANTSHELRTPLNSLLILSQQLAANVEGNLTSKQVEYAGAIQSSGVDLLTLINDILDLAKIEAGNNVSLTISKFDSLDLSRELTSMFAHVAASRGLDFRVEIDPGAPRSLWTDRQRLNQILKNLLSNAFKFTHQGEVVVRLAAASSGSEPPTQADTLLAISVSDTGIGIPSNKQLLIFEAFQQADGSTDRKYGGTGLGLSISRELTRLLGGRIRLASAPGQGTTFTVLLPPRYVPPEARGELDDDQDTTLLANGADATVMIEQLPDEAALLPDMVDTPLEQPVSNAQIASELLGQLDGAFSGLKALMIDDDIRSIFSLTSVLEREAIDVVSAETAREGIELLRGTPDIDVVLIDLRMPEMDGYQAIGAIRELADFQTLPIIAVTASAMKGDREKALAAGASDYITKPVNIDELRWLLYVWLVVQVEN